MKLILLIIAIILNVVLLPFGVFAAIIASLHAKSFKLWQSYIWQVAYTLDQSGNTINQHLLNATLIEGQTKIKFGNPDETVSSVLGKNQRSGTLTKTGKVLVLILHKLDPNHSLDAIEDDEI